MKCEKLTYKTPLFVSVVCDALTKEDDNRIELGPRSVYGLYSRTYEVQAFLDNHAEVMQDNIPEEWKPFIYKAEFGKCMEEGNELFLLTEVYTKKDLTDREEQLVRDWVITELYSGWGDKFNFDFDEVLCEEVEVTEPQFDEYECEFVAESYTVDAHYYLNAWVYGESEIELYKTEEVDVYIPYQEPVVHSAYCKLNDRGEYITRTVYKAPNIESAFQCIKNSGAIYDTEMLRLIEEKGSLADPVEVFIVLAHTGLFSQFLPIVGFMNNGLARLFELDAESGDIDLQDYYDRNYEEFYQKLLNN